MGFEIAQSDFLVVVFAHHDVSQFPNALAALNSAFLVAFQQLDHAGRGFILYYAKPV